MTIIRKRFIAALVTAIVFTALGCDTPADSHPSGNGGKKTGAAVGMPTLASKTDTSVTINAVDAPDNGQTVEYAINTSTAAPLSGWQDGLSFSGLTPATAYCVFARSRENDAYNAGIPNAGLLVTTDPGRSVGKSPGAAVSKPTLASKTDTGVTINAVDAPDNGQTVEYAIHMDSVAPNSGWQDGLGFSGLTPATAYCVFARSKENNTHNAGAASAGLLVTTDPGRSVGKSPGAAVGTPTLASKTDTSVTIHAVTAPGNGQTVEYAIHTDSVAPNSGWQDGLGFSGLTPATAYYVFARSKENSTHNAGAPSAGLSVTTDPSGGGGKSPGAAVGTPTLASKTDTDVTINAVAAPGNGQTVEYIMGTSTVVPESGWQDELTFSGLTAETTYYIFARSKENSTHNAGTPSAGLEVTTDPSGSGGKSPGAAVNKPTLASKTDTSITIHAVAVPGNGQTVEYNIGTSAEAPISGWHGELTFSGLAAETTYYIFARSKENNTHNAGAHSAGLEVTTNITVIMYTVTITPGIQHGAITANPASGHAETTVTLTITSADGYRLKNNSLSVKRQDNQNNVPVSGTGNTRTFTLPAANVTVSGEFELIPQNTVQVEFDGFGNEVIDLTGSAGTISRDQELTVTVNGSYDSYDWYVTGGNRDWEWDDETGSSIRIYFYWYSPIGVHTVTVIVTKNGVPYSKELTFRLVY